MANNNALFNAAYTGVIAGQNGWIQSATPAQYDTLRTRAVTVATAIDALIAPGAPTTAQATLLSALVEAQFAGGRFPISGAFSATAGAAIVVAYTNLIASLL